jgi:NADPH:quinone reductase-like Zn-dependent oxidoreductase
MHAPQSSRAGKAHYIEAVGEDVKDLKPGDRVCIIGSKESETWIPLPDAPDLYMTRHGNAVVVVTPAAPGEE